MASQDEVEGEEAEEAASSAAALQAAIDRYPKIREHMHPELARMLAAGDAAGAGGDGGGGGSSSIGGMAGLPGGSIAEALARMPEQPENIPLTAEEVEELLRYERMVKEAVLADVARGQQAQA